MIVYILEYVLENGVILNIPVKSYEKLDSEKGGHIWPKEQLEYKIFSAVRKKYHSPILFGLSSIKTAQISASGVRDILVIDPADI